MKTSSYLLTFILGTYALSWLLAPKIEGDEAQFFPVSLAKVYEKKLKNEEPSETVFLESYALKEQTELNIQTRYTKILLKQDPSANRVSVRLVAPSKRFTAPTVSMTETGLDILLEPTHASSSKNLFSWTWSERLLEITLPNSKLESVKILTTSGGVEVDAAEFQQLKISSNSGNVKIQNTKVSQLAELSTTSGDVSTKETTMAQLKVRTTSGDIRTDGTAKTIITQSSSGNQKLNFPKAKSIQSMSSSGSITMKIHQADVSLKTSSGNQKVEVLTGSKLSGSLQSSSGDIRLKFSDQAPSLSLTTSTASGDVSIAKKYSYKKEGNTYKINDGSGALKVQTSSGDVVVR